MGNVADGHLGSQRHSIKRSRPRQIRIASRCSGYQCNLPCLVMPRLTTDIPNFELISTSLPIPSHLILADSQYHVSRDVDLIIGNGYLWEPMCVGQHRLGAKLPVLLKTRLGWALAGRIRADTKTQERTCHVVTNEQLRDQVAHHSCKECFVQTVTQNADGRYCVTIPFNDKLKGLGDSRVMAERRFFDMEKRLLRSPDLRRAYTQFVREYIDLGHMSKVSQDACQRATVSYYLPHHSVVKETSTTTKVRVVFGSTKSSSGISINDAQLVGPRSPRPLPHRGEQLLLTGAETVTEARQIKGDVESILRQLGFVLRKWASNEAATLRESSEATVPITPEAERDPNTLGLSWNSSTDVLQFHVNTPIITRVTKRLILSQLARVFDPLGPVAPITISAKLLMQTMWRLELSWDESVPQHIFTEFCNFQSDVRSLGQVSIRGGYRREDPHK